MNLRSQRYLIAVSVETMPSLARFDIVHDPGGIRTDELYLARVFTVNAVDGTSRSVAVLDSLCAGNEPCAVLEGDCLTVILFNRILRIRLSDGALLECVDCPNWGGLNEIHEIPDGYIIWGEGNVFRYDRGLNRIWEFTGRDILVSPDNRKHLWIEDNRIHCRDFLGWHYVLDFEGNLICEFYEE